MSGARRGWMLLAVLVAMMVASGHAAMAQMATTTVQDTVYSANGTPATGSVVVSWNAFTTAAGQAVAAGSTSATIGAGGVLTLSLAPNVGSTPMGSYYTAVFHLGDGTTSREYWVIPVAPPGGGVATLAAIKNEVLPASVAMQTVSKQYVDQAIAAAAMGVTPLDASPYVAKAGDTMTGPLVLPGDPVSTNQAADKHYVDTSVAGVAAGLVVFGPSGGGHSVGLVPDPGAIAGTTHYLREDGTWDVPAGGGGGGSGSVTSFAVGTWPAWLAPTVTNGTTTPTLAVTASAIPNAALAAINFSFLTGTATVAQLPMGIPNANLANSVTTVNGVACALGSTCTITSQPATDIKYYPAAVCDGGTAFASGVTRYDNQQPQAGCVLPASSTAAYLAFNAAASLPQYASATIATPTYWTGTSLYIKFAGTATTGNVGWVVDTACTNDGQVISTATFGTATTVTTTVSSTAGASVTTAVFANVGLPGTNGCAAGTTVPGSLLTYRIHRSPSDTQAGNANLLGVVLVTGRSQ